MVLIVVLLFGGIIWGVFFSLMRDMVRAQSERADADEAELLEVIKTPACLRKAVSDPRKGVRHA